MQLAIFIVALLCSATTPAAQSVTFFYPYLWTTPNECTGSNSWTKWFNSAKPISNGNLDQELLSVIQASSPRDVCARPQGAQAQSVSLVPAGSHSGSWSLTNGLVTGFTSKTPGLDFQIRFCCPNTDFTPTTTTTTTPRPIPSSTCGRAEISHSLQLSKIFGGSHAVPNSWPWQVLYEEKKACGVNKVCMGLCGGTLIDNRHVLTASHCIGTTNPAAITITAGLHNKKDPETNTRQVRAVERIFKHPKYSDQSLENDITILRLAQPVTFNKYVQPACLPGPDPPADADVVLIGWGALQLNGGAYDILKQTKVKVIGDCNRYWRQVDEERQVCVGHTGTGDSACQGDSGGPMLYQYKGQWVVAGVASFVSGNGCTTFSNSHPNVYVRVSAYLPWIRSVVSS